MARTLSLLMLSLLGLIPAPAHAGAILTQTPYAWRNDDGSEKTATFAAPQDTPGVAGNGVQRLRLQVANTSDADVFAFWGSGQ